MQQIESHKKILHILNFFSRSSCLPVLSLEKRKKKTLLCSAKHTFSKLRVRHGKIKTTESANVHTHVSFLHLNLPNSHTGHTRKHRAAARVFHRQKTSIRDSSPCCHDNDYIHPKHGFLSCDLLCPPPHPLGVCFQHNAWNCNQRTSITQDTGSNLSHKPGAHREGALTTTAQIQTRQTRGLNLS